MRVLKSITEINEVINKELALIIVKGKNCSVCVSVALQLETRFSNIPLYSIDFDEVKVFAGQYLIFSIPTVLIFSHGKELIREVRFIDFSKLERSIKNILEKGESYEYIGSK